MFNIKLSAFVRTLQGNKQGLTHTTNSNKTKIDFTWKAPPSSQGDIHFK